MKHEEDSDRELVILVISCTPRPRPIRQLKGDNANVINITEAGSKFSPSTVKPGECPAEDGSKSQAPDSSDFAPPWLARGIEN